MSESSISPKCHYFLAVVVGDSLDTQLKLNTQYVLGSLTQHTAVADKIWRALS